MAYESKPGDAVAWAKDATANEKAPDYKGSIIAHRDIKKGERISLALWLKDAGRGAFLSGRVEDYRTKTTPSPSTGTPETDAGGIPF